MAKPVKYFFWGIGFLIVFAMSPLVARVWISDTLALSPAENAADIQGDRMVVAEPQPEIQEDATEVAPEPLVEEIAIPTAEPEPVLVEPTLPAPEPEVATADSIGKVLDDGSIQLSFDELAAYEYIDHSQNLDYDMSQHVVDAQIPDRVKALNEQTIIVSGFMVPVDMDEGMITSFILTNSTLLCCYGIMPNMNEWVWVEMEEGTSAEYYNNIPVKVKGTIQVGEEIEQNIIISLYRMNATEVGLPHEL